MEATIGSIEENPSKTLNNLDEQCQHILFHACFNGQRIEEFAPLSTTFDHGHFFRRRNQSLVSLLAHTTEEESQFLKNRIGAKDFRGLSHFFYIWLPMGVPFLSLGLLGRGLLQKKLPIAGVTISAAHLTGYFSTPGSKGNPRPLIGCNILPVVFLQGSETGKKTDCFGFQSSQQDSGTSFVSNRWKPKQSWISGPYYRNTLLDNRLEFSSERKPTIYLLHPHGMFCEAVANLVTTISLLQQQNILPVRKGTKPGNASPLVMLYDKKLVLTSALGMYMMSLGGGHDIDFLDKDRVRKRMENGDDIAILAGGFFEVNMFERDTEGMYFGQYPFWLERAKKYGYAVESVRMYNGATLYADIRPNLPKKNPSSSSVSHLFKKKDSTTDDLSDHLKNEDDEQSEEMKTLGVRRGSNIDEDALQKTWHYWLARNGLPSFPFNPLRLRPRFPDANSKLFVRCFRVEPHEIADGKLGAYEVAEKIESNMRKLEKQDRIYVREKFHQDLPQTVYIKNARKHPNISTEAIKKDLELKPRARL